jgi:hypothetical protein
VLFGLVFLICGLAFKVSAAPFHMWTPDVYEGAPTPVGRPSSPAAPKLAAMVLLARTLSEGFGIAPGPVAQVILVIAVLSSWSGPSAAWPSATSSACGLFSSIANIGYALLGHCGGHDRRGQAMLVFMVLYMIDVTGFFACHHGAEPQRQADGADRGHGRPVQGRPPGIGPGHDLPVAVGPGPAAVLGLLGQGLCLQGGHPGRSCGFAALGLVASVVAAFYYLRLIKLMWFDPSPGLTDPAPARRPVGRLCGGGLQLPAGPVRHWLAGRLCRNGGARPGPGVIADAWPVLRFDQLDSTNAEARRRAEAGETGPLWITARDQTAGRGRRGRAWSGHPGNLAATLLITTDKAPAEAAMVSFVAALGAHDVMQGFAAPGLVRLKWPNDVLIAGDKAAGLLIESGARDSGGLWLAVGMGLNLAWSPDDAERPATALIDHLAGRSGAGTQPGRGAGGARSGDAGAVGSVARRREGVTHPSWRTGRRGPWAFPARASPGSAMKPSPAGPKDWPTTAR